MNYLYVYFPIYLVHFPFHQESSNTGKLAKDRRVWRGKVKIYLELLIEKEKKMFIWEEFLVTITLFYIYSLHINVFSN